MVETRNPPWAELPIELLSAIANFLTSESIDIRTFRAVCKSWNLSSPSPSPFILSVMLPLTAPYPAYCLDVRFFHQDLGLPVISATAVFVLRNPEDTKSWVLFADQLTPGKIMIRQPFTKKYYRMPVNFPRYLDVPNIRVDEIARFYNFSFHSDVSKPPNVWSGFVDKVVLNSDESAAVVLFQTGQLGLSKLRAFPFWEGGGWETVQRFRGDNGVGAERVDDVVNYKGRILSVDRVGRVYDVGFTSSDLRVIGSGFAEVGTITKRYRLVESNGELYLVVRGSVGEETFDGDEKFAVFKLHKNLTRWVPVSNVGGRIFFFGLDFSFSASPQELGGSFGTNCVVYKEGSFRDYGGVGSFGPNDVVPKKGSFRDYGGGVDDNTMLSRNIEVWHMEDPCHIDVIGAYPGYSTVLWPPPAWLWRDDNMLKRLGNLEAALDGLLKSITAQDSKAMSKDLSSLENMVASEDNANLQDDSGIWKVAHTAKEYLNEVREIYKLMESNMTNAVSKEHHNKAMNLQNQVGSSKQGCVNLLHRTSKHSETDDGYLSSKSRLHASLFHLEESTSKLQNTLKVHQQLPPADVIVVEEDVNM